MYLAAGRRLVAFGHRVAVSPAQRGLASLQRSLFCSSGNAAEDVVVPGPSIHLDFQFLRDNLPLVTRHVEERRFGENCNPSRVASLYDKWRDAARELDQLRARRNSLAAQMPKASPQERPAFVEEGRSVKARVAELTSVHNQLQTDLLAEAVRIPNLSSPGTPVGPEPQARVLAEVGATSAEAQAVAQHHNEWMLAHRMLDAEAASKASGPRYLYFTREAALLELALINWATQRAVAHGFSPVITPDVVHGWVVSGCGFNPRGRDSQVFKIQGEDAYLSGTAEVPLAGRYADQILEEAELPLRCVGFGRAYRKEVGNSGAQTRGIYRVHQFSKVELFALATAQQSPRVFEEILEFQQSMFRELGLHFRVLEMPTEELGAPAFRKVDIEAWMPGMNKWGEISSTSTCTDYQARRLNIRHNNSLTSMANAAVYSVSAEQQQKEQAQKPPGWFAQYQSPSAQARANPFVHTLNGTACAIPRTMIALIEQGMQENRRVRIPEVLRPFMMGQAELPFTGPHRLP